MFLLGLSAGQLLAGPISDIHGRRLPLLIGLIGYTLSSILCVLAPNIWVLVVLRFIQGMTGASGIVIARAIVRDLYSGSELTKFFSLLMLVNGAVPIFSPIVGGQILRVTNWQGVFVVLGIVGGLLLVAAIILIPDTLATSLRSENGFKGIVAHFKVIISDRKFMGYTLSSGFAFASMFVYISASPFVLQNIYYMNPQEISLFFAINGVGLIGVGQLSGRLVSRISEHKQLFCSLLVLFLSGLSLYTFIVLGNSLLGILLCLFIVVSSLGVVSTTAFSLAMQEQGQASGCLMIAHRWHKDFPTHNQIPSKYNGYAGQ